MVSKIKFCFVLLVLIGSVFIADGDALGAKQETSIPAIKIVKSQYQEENSKAFIPQVGGMTDTDLQTQINNNLKTTIFSLKDESPNNSIHGDFEVFLITAICLAFTLGATVSHEG